MPILKLEDLHRVYQSQSGCIVEGVCLLQVFEAAQLDIDVLVYMKRMQREIWADESECDVSPESVDHFLKGEKESLIKLGVELSPFTEEIIRYHSSYRPFDLADFLYLRNDKQNYDGII